MHDVISIHTPMLETAIFAVYAKLLGRGLVITHHGDLVLPSGAFNRFVEFVTFNLFKMAGQAAHGLIAYSRDYADHSYYIAPFRDKTSAVYPPIQIPEPEPRRVAELRAKWLGDAASTGKLIGYAGRFVEEKRPDVLIRALPQIHEKFPGSKIVFAGQYDIKYENFYEQNRTLLEQHKESLLFLGLLEDEHEMANFYAACDVLALPSDTECFALVQVEAMRCGTPVVATNIPGAREVVKVTEMGELSPPGDPQAFGDALLRVLSDRPTYVKPLSEIDRKFNFEETVDRYERHLRNAARAAGTIPADEAAQTAAL
jgi:glycosyltransferase involved in cell wall biosynthesis